MYINFWYPIATSDSVTTEAPVKVQIMGVNLAVFREDDGTPRVLSNVCIHRGASLGDGKNGRGGKTIACPYHGWEYNGEGQCTTIPALGYDAKIPARARVDSYPVEEKYGIIFAFLGDEPEDTRQPNYVIEEDGQEDWWRDSLVNVLEMDFTYERSIENGLDVAHNEFVHPTHGFEGEKEDYQTHEIEMWEQDWGLKFRHIFDAPPIEGEAFGVREEEGDLEFIGYHYGPNVLISWIHLTEEDWTHQYFFEAPIDEYRTRIFFVSMRNFMQDEFFDEGTRERNLAIAGEDRVVLDQMEPVVTPPTNNKEMLVVSDGPVIKYREYLKRWEQKGWRIDARKLEETRKHVAYAIPSPARREKKGWTIDPIPLVDPAE